MERRGPRRQVETYEPTQSDKLRGGPLSGVKGGHPGVGGTRVGKGENITFGHRMFAVPNGHAGSLLIGRLGPYLGHSSKGDGGEKQGEHTHANSTNTCSPPSLHPFHGTSLRVC